jgi:hypothetical protein
MSNMCVTGVSQPRRTSRTLTLPSPAASHRLAAPAQGEEPANQATATATEASAARAHRNAGLRAERREGDMCNNKVHAAALPSPREASCQSRAGRRASADLRVQRARRLAALPAATYTLLDPP